MKIAKEYQGDIYIAISRIYGIIDFVVGERAELMDIQEEELTRDLGPDKFQILARYDGVNVDGLRKITEAAISLKRGRNVELERVLEG